MKLLLSIGCRLGIIIHHGSNPSRLMMKHLSSLAVFPQVAVIKTGDKVKQLPELVLVEGRRSNNSQPRHTLRI
uniref:RNA-binding protein n=1 Tax=Cherax quadricarinatus TaxID=27406 RepID=G0ZJ17_CHEQU|nr:RNA-binding protein [Cherax quadricarinatus]